MIKVKELLEKMDTSSSLMEHWSMSIFDMAGMIEFGYINSHYKADRVHPAILDCEVESYILGYSSISVKIKPVIEATYETEERCLMDGYEKINLAHEPVSNEERDCKLYAKPVKYKGQTCCHDWTFAEVM